MFENMNKAFLLAGITVNKFLAKEENNKEFIKIKKHLFIIGLIGSKSDCTIKDIVSFLQIPPSTATSRLNGLVKDGLINRETSSTNRRYMALSLTEKGEKIHQHLNQHLKAHIQQLIQPLSMKEQQTFLALFDKILNSIGEE
ncbi:hypothetical protein NEF87_002299 [Candidatus Lokiarchaeum ossiferum]|uniref:HTH marR-type domain-containing protein n=1 Tax=Candidatus Lokiarchaeum ossiferum TaxID=2951803 RepID=A0ABY6HR76_9ARCH|nr:hypothetical protein NEF87_002299 [Candidatus Lokiarchaeum sp. B-35]